MSEWTWEDWSAPLVLSLKICFTASLFVAILGVWAAWWMTRKKRRGKLILETIFMLPLVLPPTVIGFLLLVTLGRRGWVGIAYEWLFNQPIIFTWIAGIIAAVVVAFPLVYQTMKTGFQGVERHLEDSARSVGAGEWQVFRYITLPLAGRSFVSSYILGFARSLGEFGATLMIAGNIPGVTQTTPTAIYTAVESGHMTLAWSWTAAIIAVSFLMLIVTGRLNETLNNK
ncbi:molybdate ABC transporter permease subunit [Paenibacillus lupini]|uniref:molybdate ABC transporter permease subunit n=1 Tax=Paenibacillus lupini TaxID=1450204 RepID=UPI0014203ECA|nr:molybdate ABC transporter permease subunit [Paenibacillus lupini]NIK25316.1 molybdate transport system permease protein [Paenibacillus lupini]